MTEPSDGGRPALREPTALERALHRMRHVYHTRVRTTTVALIALWIGLLVLYGFTSQHYAQDVGPAAPQPTQSRQQNTPTTSTSTPSSIVEQTPSGTTAETTEPASTSTEDTDPLEPRHQAPAETTVDTGTEDLAPGDDTSTDDGSAR